MLYKVQNYLILLVKSILSILKILILSSFKTSLKVNLLKEETIILANGPSLLDTLTRYPDIIKNRNVFCVNYFAISPFFMQIKPAYYVITAPEIWYDNMDEERKKKYRHLFETISEQVQWPLHLFLPFLARKSPVFTGQINPILSQNHNIHVHFFNQSPVEGLKTISFFLFRKRLGMPRPHNVLIPSIVLVLNLGSKKIYLLGADHSWLKEISVDADNNVLFSQKHFYDPEAGPGKLIKLGNRPKRLHELLMKFVHAFSGYFVLREYAEKLDAVILNATPGSFIDAFDRITPESIANATNINS
jgi:hypothetical protein